MSVRPFEWHDLPMLYRYRNQSVFLDTALLLTRGPLVLSGALFSALAPSLGVFTYIFHHDGAQEKTVVGQFIHPAGSPLAHLTFFSPQERLDAPLLARLLEHMLAELGERGALRLLAEVDEESPAFEVLRSNGFGVYTRQRIWQVSARPAPNESSEAWRPARPQDEGAIRALYNNLVPGMVQQIEPFISQRPKGMVYYQGGDLLAYVELRYGHLGIWAHPFVHPATDEVSERFVDFLSNIPNRRSRPVYVCIRSYQAWLEATMEILGAEAGPRQAVMARQLAASQKALRLYAIPSLEGGQAEITAPVAQVERLS